MKLPRLAIDNYQFTILVFLLVVLAGFISFFTMPRTENPSIYIPGGTVIVIYPGASPTDLEQLVAIPIEESINELEDIKQMTTTIRDGIVSIGVEFTYNTDAKEKYDEMVSKVNDVKNDLPSDIYDIKTLRWSSADVDILQLALVSDSAGYNEMEKLGDDLKDEIEKVKGIRKVEMFAYPEREVRVSLNMEKMALSDISIEQVANAINSNNANIPGGDIRIGGKNFNIKTSGSYNDIREIENTVVGSAGGKLIYLKNIASVKFGYGDKDYIARFNGERAIFITAQQKEDQNIFDIMDQVNPIIDHFRQNLDPGTGIHYVFDQSKYVDRRINSFLKNLLQGIILVGIIILLALGLRSSLIVIFAVPLSIIIGLWVVDLSGFGLQQISIAGLMVALGMLVDNSIVMVENINRFLGMGHSRRDAAVLAAEQIGWPVVSATATTVFAFIPLIMMPDKAGDFIKSLPVTISATLIVSLFIALTVTPLTASKVLKKPENNNNNRFNRSLNRLIQGPYRRLLHFSLKRRGLTLLIAVLILMVSLSFFRFIGISFFPKAELPQFMIRIEMPEGSSLQKTDEAARYVEHILDTIPAVQHYATNVGHGNPRIYYNMSSASYNKNFGEIYVRLKTYDIDTYDALIARLRKIFARFPGGKINIKEFEQGTPVQAPVEVDIMGDDPKVLKKISADVEQFVSGSDGAINIDNQLNKSKSEIYFHINKDKAGMVGVPVVEIDRTIRTCVSGAAVSKYRDAEGKEYNIVLRMPEGDTISVPDFDKIYVKSLTGRYVPLLQLATIEFRDAPGLLTRIGMKKDAAITADIEKGYMLDDVLQPIIEKLNSYHFPNGYSYKIAGELENRQESYGGMSKAVLLAIIAIFAVLVLQFRSFKQPWIIFAAIPLAFIGSVWALLITGNSFSFTAFVGLISLVGIVVNNSIILVDYTNKLMAEGKDKLTAVKEAGETRFTPIILTSFTTIGGLLPLTLSGGTLWAPMGWTIIGGLLTSTLLTLIIVPVLYHLVTAPAKNVEQAPELKS